MATYFSTKKMILVLPILLVVIIALLVLFRTRSKAGCAVLCACGIAFVGLALLTSLFPILGNLLAKSHDPYFWIPEESSMWEFRTTVLSPGSGDDQWIYGRDSDNFYHYIGEKGAPYAVFSRADVKSCSGFDAHRYDTWCSKYVRIGKSEVFEKQFRDYERKWALDSLPQSF